MIAKSDTFAADMTADHDRKNLEDINRAVAEHVINDEAADYLRMLYSDGMNWFREVFHVLGKCLGAPKAPVVRYDYDNDCGIDEKIKISDINPLSPYLVQHRLDMDPMRNQFFTTSAGHKIDLSVSSIVTVCPMGSAEPNNLRAKLSVSTALLSAVRQLLRSPLSNL